MKLDNLGIRLYSLRKAAGVSRAFIEKNFNIPAVSIRSWEKNNSDICIGKLNQYLCSYEKLGIKVTLSDLIENTEKLGVNNNENILQTSDDFINTTFIQDILKLSHNLVFYSDQIGKIHYFNSVFNYLLIKKISCNYTNDKLFITDILPKVINIKEDIILQKVLKGIPSSFEYYINQINSKVCLELIPNINMSGKVIGFSASYKS